MAATARLEHAPLEQAQLEITKLSKTFGVRRVLHQFSLTVVPGEVVAVVGPNGSGKSTLLKMAAGLLRPSSGQIVWAGNGEAAFRRKNTAYAAPDLALYPELSGRENLRFFDTVAGRTRTDAEHTALFERVGLGKRGDDRVGQYSSGMRQRLRLAFALLVDAPLLLLDEPSLALDSGGVQIVEGIIAHQKARGGVTLLATNDDREAAWGSRTVAMGA